MTKAKIQELVITVVIAVAIGLIAGHALAEVNAAGPAKPVAGSAKGTVFFDSNSRGGIPTAVLVYSKDGSMFWIRRGMGSSTLETLPLPIPENQSLIIPVSGYKAVSTPDDTFKVKINVTAGADSVFVIPLYR